MTQVRGYMYLARLIGASAATCPWIMPPIWQENRLAGATGAMWRARWVPVTSIDRLQTRRKAMFWHRVAALAVAFGFALCVRVVVEAVGADPGAVALLIVVAVLVLQEIEGAAEGE